MYMHGTSCPSGATCNPPPPLVAECPASLRDGGVAEGPERPGKVRIKEQLWAHNGKCTFAPDYFCATPPAAGCEQSTSQELSCRELSPKESAPRIHHVDSFIARRADGTCTQYGAVTCRSGCELPVGKTVPCDAPKPGPSFPVRGDAPPPFTAEQIRDATQSGRRYEWRVETDGKPPATEITLFAAVNEEGADIVSGADDESLQSAKPTRVTWDDLLRHAAFPAEQTSIQRKQVTVGAGTFDCKVYTVKKADGVVEYYYFADDLPGAPVVRYTEKGGKRILTSKLVAHRASAEEPEPEAQE